MPECIFKQIQRALVLRGNTLHIHHHPGPLEQLCKQVRMLGSAEKLFPAPTCRMWD